MKGEGYSDGCLVEAATDLVDVVFIREDQIELDTTNFEITCCPSTTHRSPTSNGCMTKRNTIASRTVFRVLPHTRMTRRNCDEVKSSSCVVAISSTSNQMTRIIKPTMTSTMRCSLFTAVFVSFRDSARARLSRYILICAR